jgi:polyphenol oxidase
VIVIPKIFSQFGQIAAAQSTRLGGYSQAPYQSLNLGLSVGDNPDTVLQNRETFFQKLGLTSQQVSLAHQIHEAHVLTVTQPGSHTGYDAQITNQPGIGIAVSVADCCPILVYDAHNQAVAAIHAGWRGTVKHIVSKTLTLMQAQYGTQGAYCYAYVGVCISTKAFEVSADVAQHFDQTHKTYNKQTDKYHVDLKQANAQQLRAFGISNSHIEISEDCTFLNNDRYFSHRKENGNTGRMLAAIALKH